MKEEQLHKQICNYIKIQYKNIIFNTDASGLRLTIGQAVKIKNLRSSNGIPDIVIYESRKGFHGLFLEVKKETPYKKDGNLKKCKHLEEQNEIAFKLIDKGYYCKFVWNFEQAKKLIDDYLGLQNNNKSLIRCIMLNSLTEWKVIINKLKI